jgi:hypothetical protein
LKCKETIRPGYVYQFVITRSAVGKISLYLNGYPCQSGSVNEHCLFRACAIVDHSVSAHKKFVSKFKLNRPHPSQVCLPTITTTNWILRTTWFFPQDNLVFFHDDDGHDVAGTVYRIHVWNKDLTDDVVLSTCNCILPASDKACKANLVHIPAYSKLEYSSTYGNYQVKLAIFC